MTTSKKVEELLRKAYKLGFDIGYFGHFENVGWIRRERKRPASISGELGISDRVEAAYQKGKRRGIETKRHEISKSVAQSGKIEPEEPPAEILVEDLRRPPPPSPSLSRPKILSPLPLVRMEGVLQMPRMVRSPPVRDTTRYAVAKAIVEDSSNPNLCDAKEERWG